MSVAENLAVVLEDIRQTALSCGRDPQTIRLIAVSKTWPASHIQPAVAAGQLHLGENRVQEMEEKHGLLPDVHWHLIGSLQTNKVKYIAPYVFMIHSIDSLRLMSEISRQAQKCGRVIPGLFQVNISHEPQKGGFEPDELAGAIAHLQHCPGLRIEGLMGMASFTEDTALITSEFTALREMLDRLKPVRSDMFQPNELCMGMSGDYRIAIACGATMVRIGSAIFGSRT